MGSTPATTTNVIIPLNGTASNAIKQSDMNGILATVISPAALTNNKFHFEESFDGSTWYAVHRAKSNGASSKYEINYTASVALSVDTTSFYGARFLRIAVENAEEAARTFTLAFYSSPTQ